MRAGLVALALIVAGCRDPVGPPTEHVLPSGLRERDLVIGMGAPADSGDHVAVMYALWLLDGTKIDQSHVPFTLHLGAGEVIRGFDEGVRGMRLNGTRELIVPPSLGYGAPGYPPWIPPNATLRFQVTLVHNAGGAVAAPRRARIAAMNAPARVAMASSRRIDPHVANVMRAQRVLRLSPFPSPS